MQQARTYLFVVYLFCHVGFNGYNLTKQRQKQFDKSPLKPRYPRFNLGLKYFWVFKVKFSILLYV